MAERFLLNGKTSLESTMSFGRNHVVSGDACLEYEISGVSSLVNAGEGDLCFCDREPDAEFEMQSDGVIVLSNFELTPVLKQRFPGAICIAMPDPRAVFIDLSTSLLNSGKLQISDAVPRPFGVEPSASIGAHTVIHADVRIDRGVSIGNHCVIHRGTWIQENAVIRDHAVIGCDGINAYRGLDGRQRGFPHLASVVIGKHTQVGAGTVIPRGILSSTVIGEQVVVGNLCNIGHGAVIGNDVWMSVGTLVGGHTNVGDRTTLAMGVVVRDNLDIGEDAQVGMGSVVVRNVESGASVFGNPARSISGKLKAGPER